MAQNQRSHSVKGEHAGPEVVASLQEAPRWPHLLVFILLDGPSRKESMVRRSCTTGCIRDTASVWGTALPSPDSLSLSLSCSLSHHPLWIKPFGELPFGDIQDGTQRSSHGQCSETGARRLDFNPLRGPEPEPQGRAAPGLLGLRNATRQSRTC